MSMKLIAGRAKKANTWIDQVRRTRRVSRALQENISVVLARASVKLVFRGSFKARRVRPRVNFVLPGKALSRAKNRKHA